MIEERKFHYSQFLFPALFVLVLWVIHLLKVNTNFDFVQFGLYPRRVENLFGIITSPFIHDDWEHLTNNSIPLLLLGLFGQHINNRFVGLGICKAIIPYWG